MGAPQPTGRYPSPRALLEKYGLRAKKSWGQNFLGDEAILDDIARLAAPRQGDLVVELGSGLGHLTARLLARGAAVVAVERDRDMAAVHCAAGWASGSACATPARSPSSRAWATTRWST